MIPFYTYALFIKYFKIISSFFSKLFGEKKICIFSHSFSFKNNIKKSNAEISAHYWIVWLYSKNICFNVFISNKCLNFFQNMFYSKRIKINNIIIIHMQSNPMSSNIRILIKIYYIYPILYLVKLCSGKLSRETKKKTPLNLGSFS